MWRHALRTRVAQHTTTYQHPRNTNFGWLSSAGLPPHQSSSAASASQCVSFLTKSCAASSLTTLNQSVLQQQIRCFASSSDQGDANISSSKSASTSAAASPSSSSNSSTLNSSSFSSSSGSTSSGGSGGSPNNSDSSSSSSSSSSRFTRLFRHVTPLRVISVVALGAGASALILYIETTQPPHSGYDSAVTLPDTVRMVDVPPIDPLDPANLPELIKEHMELPFFQRLWFYVRLTFRGALLSIVWFPVLTLGAILPWRYGLPMFIRALEYSGPVFIKLGQWAATRPDLFPEIVCSSLARLQAEVHAHPYHRSLETVRANFGKECKKDGLTLVIEQSIIGSGSMGQVHRGFVMNAAGERQDVAIKVLHPHIRSHVNLDLSLLYYVANVVTHIPFSELQWVSLPEMLIQFAGFMSSHLNLKQEGENMVQFRKNFEKKIAQMLDSCLIAPLPVPSLLTSSPNITFPSPIYPFVGEQVLVQSVATGLPLGKFLNHSDERFDLDPANNSHHRTIAERITKAHVLRHEKLIKEAEESGLPVPVPPLKKQHVSPLHSEIARLGLQMYLHMLIENNFVHSDLHPGNILVQLPEIVQSTTPDQAGKSEDGKDANNGLNSGASVIHRMMDSASAAVGGKDKKHPNDVREIIHKYESTSSPFLKSSHVNLVILDSGLVTQLSGKNRKNFLSLLGSLVLRDGRLAARLMLDNAPKHACVNAESLQDDMHEIVSAIPLENLGRVDLGMVMGEVMNCVRKHQVKLESEFASLVISIAIIEGIGRQLDPDISLFHEAVPIMLKNQETRRILLQTAGPFACAKLGLHIAKEEIQAAACKDKP